MGATGDAQAKLFRQIETLQTQYAVSSENWRRIEESLTARMTGLEKERDELSRKEHDLRQKAREFVGFSACSVGRAAPLTVTEYQSKTYSGRA